MVVSKKFFIYLAAAVIAVAIGFILWQDTATAPKPPEEQQTNGQPQNQPANEPAKVATAPAAKPMTYEEALKVYGGANLRIQLSLNGFNNCIVNPANPVYKKGVKVMFDNRINAKTTIYLNGVAYSIPAFGFKLITLTTTKPLPYTIKIDCNSGKNNGQILLQQ